MIELIETPQAEQVIRFKGCLLASRFNPWAEAGQWVNSRKAFADKVKTVFVLGLGSGYHVAELLKSTSASVVVIENQSEIVSAVSRIHDFPAARVQIEVVSSARELRTLETVRKAIQASFTVLLHAPSVALNPELYRECQTQLLGRDWGNLNWQWKMRNAPDFDRTARIDSQGPALTIHDLSQTELVQNSEERERQLFMALRELVK